jgi:hypothetical protein
LMGMRGHNFRILETTASGRFVSNEHDVEGRLPRPAAYSILTTFGDFHPDGSSAPHR